MRALLVRLPFLALGPLTGPLAALALHYVTGRRWGMAAVCCLGMAEVWLGLPALLGVELSTLARLVRP